MRDLSMKSSLDVMIWGILDPKDVNFINEVCGDVLLKTLKSQ